MEFKPKKSNGIWIGLLISIFIFGFFLWGIDYSLGPDDRILAIMLYIPVYVFIGVFFMLLWGGLTLEYICEETQLIIRFGFIKAKIPWDQINTIERIEGKVNYYSIFGMSWPGFIAGLYSAKGLGYVKMYGSDNSQGFLLLRTNLGLYGLTPDSNELADKIAAKTNLQVNAVNMDDLSPEKKGINMHADGFYKLLLIINVVFIVLYGLYLLIFFPGSGAPSFIILLLILAIALFFFTLGNAARLYQFSTTGGYVMLMVGIMVTGIFFILSLSEIHL
ncbi:MAG TPA: PH domain-containing protein [Syntrophomonadaceae bacterium]|nr:PH domain-containing protein [Syntrophomonadaceae bacterium]HNX28688.1 PH domain-containing protein [Syntrophomonadaceae bacterium]HPR93514.1 PH domain-containing protein [Syntrophomonadaceae bacterium]